MLTRNDSTDNSTCQEFSATEVEQIIIAKVAVSCAAVVMCLVSIVVIVFLRQYHTFVHRLVLYLMIVGVFYGMIIGLEIAPVHHDGREAVVRDGLEDLCVAVAFISQIAVWQFMLFFVWIITYLLLLAIFKYRANSKRQEIAGIFIVLSLPLTFNWIPLVQDMYGLSGLWCWIKNTNGNCHKNYQIGVIYQFTLFYGPLVLLILFSFVSFLAIVIVVCRKRLRNLEVDRQTVYQQALREALPLLLHPVIYNIIAFSMIANRVYYAITLKDGEKPFFPLWFAHALADPMQVLVVPVAFLLHPGTIRQLLKGRHNRSEQTDDGTAYIVSQEYPYSEEEPLVIKSDIRHSRRSSGYHSILEGNLHH